MSANIVLPLLAPVAMVSIVYAFADAKRRAHFSPLLIVKDGQLAWAAVIFTTSALYEHEEAVRRMSQAPSGLTLFLLIGILLSSCLIPLIGLIFPQRKLSVRLNGRQRFVHYKVFAGSLFVAGVSAICDSGVHFGWLN
ncbi:hypothetical protein [Luteibacter yeojuensis]|uniref:hypothetical protein n=1 Tax=Luteibacter yeojuensis TaxID=345309 RepID=UPI0012EECE4F|nr:hypothetical protein [Luteibacter yeojuensis]